MISHPAEILEHVYCLWILEQADRTRILEGRLHLQDPLGLEVVVAWAKARVGAPARMADALLLPGLHWRSTVVPWPEAVQKKHRSVETVRVNRGMVSIV